MSRIFSIAAVTSFFLLIFCSDLSNAPGGEEESTEQDISQTTLEIFVTGRFAKDTLTVTLNGEPIYEQKDSSSSVTNFSEKIKSDTTHELRSVLKLEKNTAALSKSIKFNIERDRDTAFALIEYNDSLVVTIFEEGTRPDF